LPGPETNLPLTDLYHYYSGLTTPARALRGGALIFSQSRYSQSRPQPTRTPAMHYKSLEEFILHLENYIECWKQFNHYVKLPPGQEILA
jgi:hypothetical protein